jgi:hypothetical protein
MDLIDVTGPADFRISTVVLKEYLAKLVLSYPTDRHTSLLAELQEPQIFLGSVRQVVGKYTPNLSRIIN